MRKQLIPFCAGNKVFLIYQGQEGLTPNAPLHTLFGGKDKSNACRFRTPGPANREATGQFLS